MGGVGGGRNSAEVKIRTLPLYLDHSHRQSLAGRESRRFRLPRAKPLRAERRASENARRVRVGKRTGEAERAFLRAEIMERRVS